MKKLKWILVVLSVVVVVVISIKIENQFKVCDRIGTIFSFDKNDCDDLDLKNSKNDVVMAQRAGGFLNKYEFKNVNYYIMVYQGGVQDANSSLQACEQKSQGEANIHENRLVVKQPPALESLVVSMRKAYFRRDYSNAVDLAHIGLEMIQPVLDPYMTNSFTIQAKFAYNASAVYAMIAEEAWAKMDFPTACTNMQHAVSLCGGQPEPEMLAMQAAITVDAKGGPCEVFPTNVMTALKGIGRQERGSNVGAWMRRYLEALSEAGFIQPVLVDEEGKGWLFNMSHYFGFSGMLKAQGVFVSKWPSKDGRKLTTGVINSTRYAGLGKMVLVSFPDFEDRKLPDDFDAKRYKFHTTYRQNPPMIVRER